MQIESNDGSEGEVEDLLGRLLPPDDEHAAILVQHGLQGSLLFDLPDPAARLTREDLEIGALVLVDEGEAELGVDVWLCI